MEAKAINKIPSMQTPVYHFSKGDNKRMVELDLYDGAEASVLPADASIRVRYRRTDDFISSFGISTGYETDKLYIQVPEDVTASEGIVYCKLVVNGIGYKAFFIDVEGI